MHLELVNKIPKHCLLQHFERRRAAEQLLLEKNASKCHKFLSKREGHHIQVEPKSLLMLVLMLV